MIYRYLIVFFSIIMKKTDEYFDSEVILKDIENKKAEKCYFSAFFMRVLKALFNRFICFGQVKI